MNLFQIVKSIKVCSRSSMDNLGLLNESGRTHMPLFILGYKAFTNFDTSFLNNELIGRID